MKPPTLWPTKVIHKKSKLQGAIDSAVAKQYNDPQETFVTRLMKRTLLNWKWELENEQRFAVKVADKLRIAAIEGYLQCVWCHVPNEGKRHPVTMLIMKAMGLISGSPDMWFIGATGGLLVELKYGDTDISPEQSDFHNWARSCMVPMIVLRAINDADIDNKIEMLFSKLHDLRLYIKPTKGD